MPESVPQWLAFFSRADELFYGGQAGGGKTDLLLGLALSAHRKAIIFRREYPQLRDVVVRGDEICEPIGVRYNSKWSQWRELPGRRSVELGAVQYEEDKFKYKGRPHDFKGFDEVPDMSETQVRFLGGWLRSTDPNQRCRVVMCGNPPTTAEGEWVIMYFAPWLDSQHPNPALPGELRWFAVIDGKDQAVDGPEPFKYKNTLIKPRSRTFIPARLADNPYLSNTEYESVLQSLHEPLRSQLLFGDFSIRASDDIWQVIPTAWVDAAMDRWRAGHRPDGAALRAVGVDPSRGGDDETAIAKLYDEWFELKTYPGAQVPDGPKGAALVMNAVVDDEPAPIYVDVIGIGSSVYDALRGLVNQNADASEDDAPQADDGPKWRIRKVNVAESSFARDKSRKFRFANKRSEMHWKLREALDPSSDHAIALPYDRQLKVDLCAARYSINKGGITVEPKDKIKERIQRSPDKGEAIMLAWYGASKGKFKI